IHDAVLDETYRALEGSFTLHAHFRVQPGTAPGAAHAKVGVAYQACNDSGCLFPMHDSFDVPVTVRAAQPRDVVASAAGAAGAAGGAGKAGGAAGGAPSASLQDQFQTALKAGDVGTFLWLAIVLALVSLLTPCVFPMIPITVSFFSKR